MMVRHMGKSAKSQLRQNKQTDADVVNAACRDCPAYSGDSDGVYRRADGSGYVGRVRRRTGKRKRGSSHLRRSPSYIFMLLYQDERLLIGVLHSCYIIR